MTSIKIELSADSPFIERSADGDVLGMRMPEAMIEAARLVGDATKSAFRTTEQSFVDLGERFENHPEVVTLRNWLEGKAVSVGDDLALLYWLSIHVLSEWEMLPKRTTSEHRLFNHIEQAAKALSDLLKETKDHYYRGGGHGLANARVSDLLLPSEEKAIMLPLHTARAAEALTDPELVAYDPGLDFPTVEQLLERVSQAANRLAKQGPLHSQPNKRGAKSGYFVRRMAVLFRHRFNSDSPLAIAALASIALNEVIDEDLARKHLHLAERSAARKR